MVDAEEVRAPDTQFRRAREALGLADASRRVHNAGAVADAAATVRRVAFESPSDSVAFGSPAITRTPPALKEGYTPLTQEYLRVSFRWGARVTLKQEVTPCPDLKDSSFH